MDNANILRLGSKVQGLRETWIIPGLGLSSNVYVIGSLPITLIDTGIGGEKDQLGENLREAGLDLRNVSAVIFTHAHFDHTSGLKELLRYKTPAVYIHESDYYGLRRVLSKGLKPKKLEGGEIIDTTYPLHVIHTPGHTRGSICLYHKDSGSIFSGDTVFREGFYGRTDLADSDAIEMVSSLKKLSRLTIRNISC